MTFLNILNPSSTKPTESFEVETLDSSGFSIDKNTGGIFYEASPGSFQYVEIVAENRECGVTTNLKFSLKPSNPLGQDSMLQILFPQDIELLQRDTTCYKAITSNVNP